jgi:hypothetical protein
MAAALKPMETEQQFQQAIVDLAHLCGWTVFHCYDSRKSTGEGFPDLVLVRVPAPAKDHPPQERARLVFLEVKSARGRLTKVQQTWLLLLSAVPGVQARMVQPQDWEAVVALLR